MDEPLDPRDNPYELAEFHVDILENKEIEFANPGPLGLAGFGMTTFLLNLHNAAMIMATGLIFGGLAQLIAGVMEFWKKNTFGLVAFVAYGSFWISLCLIHILPKAFGVDPPGPLALGMLLFIWGVFTLFNFIALLRIPPLHLLQVIFFLLLLLFWILAIENFAKHFGATTAAKVIQTIGGVEGIVLGLLALFLAGVELLNAHFGRVVIPDTIRRKTPPAEAAKKG